MHRAGDVFVDVVGMRDLLERAPEEVCLGVSRDLGQRSVDAQEPSVRSDQGHSDRCILERPPEPLFCLAQSLLGLPALGDVLDLCDEVERLACGVPYDLVAQSDPHDAAVGADVALLDALVPLLSLQLPAAALEVRGEIVRMGDIREREPAELLGRIAEQLAQRLVDVEPAPVRREQRNADGGVVEGDLEPLAGPQQRLLRFSAGGEIETRAEPSGQVAVLVPQGRGEAAGSSSRCRPDGESGTRRSSLVPRPPPRPIRLAHARHRPDAAQ